ncbi:hypothetical protein E3J62_10080 [candidate division TA06 bacterium]|uniref:OmpA-like domain-containing protein n=1 Tax=candidate division TA06 bacterium TaxID=2250710 RepID=A0A523UQ15_UNCT6|nr:MAG: hypothetical protein E3J62_10080 [candidate division TA06 bacterium]
MRNLEAGLLCLLLLAGWSGPSYGLPGMKGMRGTFRVVSGDVEPHGNQSLNLWFDYWRKASPSTQEEMNLKMALAAVPRPSAELYLTGGVTRAQNLGLAPDEGLVGLSDTEVGFKFAPRTFSSFKSGVNIYLTLPTGKDEFSSGRMGAGVLAIATYDFKGLESFIPIRVNANLGYHHSGRKESNAVPVGVSLELPTRFFTPIVEVTSEQLLQEKLDWNQCPLRFTQGVKVTPTRRFCFHVGYDINLAQESLRYLKAETYDWRFFFNLTLSRSLGGLGVEPGAISGAVKDRTTGEPIAARVSIKGSEATIEADPVTGYYVIKGLKPGLVSMIVEAEGYNKRVVPAFVKQGKTVARNIRLTPQKRKSWVSVVVTDMKTGEPVGADILLQGKSRKEARTDSSGNVEALELAPGRYKLICDARGYLSTSKELTVGAHKTEMVSISLLKMGEHMVVSGVSFLPATANLKIESYEGIKKVVSLIKSNPGVKFEIGGHTDKSDSPEADLFLSEKRASVFRRFLVNGYNFDETSLVTRGYGGEKPVADNSTEQGRSKNRRIEIRALGEAE